MPNTLLFHKSHSFREKCIFLLCVSKLKGSSTDFDQILYWGGVLSHPFYAIYKTASDISIHEFKV
jgi:hypothetical protein